MAKNKAVKSQKETITLKEVNSSLKELFNRIEASTGMIFVNTFEENRLIREIKKELPNACVQFWSISQGLHEIKEDEQGVLKKPQDYPEASARNSATMGKKTSGNVFEMLLTIEDDCRKKIDNDLHKVERNVYILRDLDKEFNNPRTIRKLRDIVYTVSTSTSSIIICAPGLTVPSDLEKDSAFINLEMPTRREIKDYILKNRVQDIIKVNNQDIRDGEGEQSLLMEEEFDFDHITRACMGLTEEEIVNTAAYSLTVYNKVEPRMILEEKRQIISKNDILTYFNCTETLSDLGGFKHLKDWFTVQRSLMDHPEEALAYHADQPKGILLLGTQGSGKTLAGKAMATEWGKGLIVLDMGKVFAGLVGESLAPDEELMLINDKGHVLRDNIENICRLRPEGYYALSYDNEFNPQYKKVVDFITHKRTKELVKVTTVSGRVVKVTEDHSLFTISNNGELTEVKPSELKTGSPLVVPCRSDESINHIDTINLVDLIKKNNDEDKWYVSNAYDTYGEHYIRSIVTQKDFSSYKNTNRPIAIDKVDHIPIGATIGAVYSEGKFLTRLDLNCNLMELFGWYSAEGTLSGESPRLHVHSNEIEDIFELLDQCDIKYSVYQDKDSNGSTIFFGGVSHGRILKYLELTDKNRIPSWIFNTSIEYRRAYIKGFISGDGGISGNNIECSQKSRAFIEDLQYLLSTVNIFASVYPRKDGGTRLCIHSSVYINKYLEEIGFTQCDKNIAGESLAIDINSWGHKFPKYGKLVATSKELRNATDDSKYQIDDNSDWLSYKKALKINPKIADWGVHFDMVKSIEVCKEQPEYVYDISVEDNQNFVSGTGGILCHNSEKRMRMALMQAEAAGGIILIDEIDKGLAGAGSSDRTDGGTTKRVIGTLLSWMQEPHPGLFIVATANDITNLRESHPELLRKGRFDELWFSDSPTVSEREDIFRIHLKKRGRISDNFPIDKLAKIKYIDRGLQYRYVGAEIEYAVNEAVRWNFAKNFSAGNILKIGSKQDITADDIELQLKKIIPITKVGKKAVENNRSWAMDNARNVSIYDRKIVVKDKTTKDEFDIAVEL